MSEPNGEQATLELERAELSDDMEEIDLISSECYWCGNDAESCGCDYMMGIFD